jgi:hypothetical protein
MSDQALKNYFLFDEADLTANRAGQLSESQQKKINQEDKAALKIVRVIAWALMLVALIYPLVVVIPRALAALQGHSAIGQVDWLSPLIWVAIWGGLGVYCMYCGYFQPDPKIEFKQVSGPAHIVAVEKSSGGEHSHTSIEYELHIKKVTFDVDQELASVMKQGDPYTIYYYERKGDILKYVLSVEEKV